jgi:hypothetical protein
VLAFFIECECPPDRRSATVGAGDIQSVEEFLANYSLTHIVCQACDRYYRLIGYIDENGIERSVGIRTQRPPVHRPTRRMTGALRNR